MIREALALALERRDVDPPTMEGAMELILAGGATSAQIAALAVALRMKGESVAEIAAAARVLRRHAATVRTPPGVVLDTCGTGGDGAGTLNVSTIAAIVVAACGVRVAKHGNRAVSSRCGSADLLEALGVRTDLPVAHQERLLAEVGLAFLFAPAHHPALRFAAPVRRELGVRTFFNLLGPLASPALASHQLLGVYDPARVRQLAEVLASLGTRAAWVVCGAAAPEAAAATGTPEAAAATGAVVSLDEVSPFGPTRVASLDADGTVREFEVTPADFGLPPAPADALAGGDVAHNAELLRRLLAGEALASRGAVLVNAGAALVVAGVASSPREGAERAAEAIDSGRAREKLAAVLALAASTEAA